MILGLTPEGGGTADAEGPHRTPVKALRGMGCRVGRSQGSTFALGPSTQGWGPGLRSLPALAPHPTLVLKRHPALLSLDRNYDRSRAVSRLPPHDRAAPRSWMNWQGLRSLSSSRTPTSGADRRVVTPTTRRDDARAAPGRDPKPCGALGVLAGREEGSQVVEGFGPRTPGGDPGVADPRSDRGGEEETTGNRERLHDCSPVHPTGQYANKCPQVEGHALRLSHRHAKLRRDGYRKSKDR